MEWDQQQPLQVDPIIRVGLLGQQNGRHRCDTDPSPEVPLVAAWLHSQHPGSSGLGCLTPNYFHIARKTQEVRTKERNDHLFLASFSCSGKMVDPELVAAASAVASSLPFDRKRTVSELLQLLRKHKEVTDARKSGEATELRFINIMLILMLHYVLCHSVAVCVALFYFKNVYPAFF